MTKDAQMHLERMSSVIRKLNDRAFLPLRLYRRDARMYPLSSSVNHIVGCWLSENPDPIWILAGRCRQFMEDTPASDPGALAYYAAVNELIDALDSIGMTEVREP
ncbi:MULTISPECIES: hypothetical protein [Burkholderia]|uniref:Uncharacterized protein n=1 Tax=Burkholderia ubonensis TaxID=101571 RepID=A0A105CJS1_9BURK|nr:MULTISPECIES: hypothetical protein [Burkholderia]KVA72602.1 hypothetical protein WM36_25150 [Burkholderia ubonensis]KVC80706.1 hypothetical protein WI76_11120 [Burkholderia ubonensis]KVD20798.1 hypothetical protein WI81_04405 [Burkholderia ubonensis]KVD31975.1 hypothetical protein WI84_24170 [Burkholderia ubonensis]KVD80685.1 hypothetical protein WI89_24230 [Burkholderia ubonensis]